MKFQEAYSKFQVMIKKVPMKYVYFVLLLALLSFTVWTRVQPLYLPLADVQAESNVLNFYEQQIKSSIDTQYPNLPEQNKQVLVEKELQSFISNNRLDLDNQIDMVAGQIRSTYQDSNGQTYLLGIDPYHYQRQTYYELEYGMAGNTVNEQGEAVDTYRLAPNGQVYGDTFHASVSALWHKILNIFGEFTLNYSFFMVGVLMVTLTVLFAYLFFSKETHPLVGIICGLILATSLFFVSRTTGESSDTDIYVLLFPFLTLWLYRLGIGKTALITSFLAGFFMGMYAYAWSAWWFTFVLMSIAIVLDLILKLILKKELNWHKALLFHVGTFISLGYFVNVTDFFKAYLNPIESLLNFKSVGVTSLWPNIMTTVAELNAVNFNTVIGQLGGQLVLFISLIGTVYAVYLGYKKADYMLPLYLLFWWVAAIYTTRQGVRFILLMIFPFIIGIAYAFKLFIFSAAKNVQENFKIPSLVSSIVVTFLLFIMFIPQIMAGVSAAQGAVPTMDDAWYNGLSHIRENMSEDVILTSWWDFGYWFRSVADRPVTFDGGTQLGYNAYWVGKSLSTNEHLSTGIIRMLNCGQNNAFEELYPSLNSYQQTIGILEDIVVLTKDGAQQYLDTRGLSIDVLEYTHCAAPKSIVIASGDMVSKAPVWGHFGAWNFTKAEMFNMVHSLPTSEALAYLQESYKLDSSVAVQEYNAMQAGGDVYISPYPQLLTAFVCNGDNLITCNFNAQSISGALTYDLVTEELNYTGNVNIDYIVLDDKIVDLGYKNGISIKIDVGQQVGYLSSNELTDGMFANMYWLESSDCYNLVHKEESSRMGKIMVWESDYSCLN